MTLDPDVIECNNSMTNSRIAAAENTLNETEAFLRELSNVSLPAYNPTRW